MTREMLPIALLFGWPAVVFAIVMSAAGLWRLRPVWLVAAAFAVLPMSAYLASTPRYWLVPGLVPLSLFAAAFALKRAKPGWAYALTVPLPFFYATVAFQLGYS